MPTLPTTHPHDAATVLAERIRQGRSTIVLGALPELPRDIRTVRIRCDLPGALGPLDRARDRLERTLDGDHGSGRPDPTRAAERFASACNRFASHAPGAAALVLDAVDRADAATHHALAKLLRTPGALTLPLILVVRDEPKGTFLEVVTSIEGEPAETSSPALPGEVLNVLRAAAIAGEQFESAVVADLLAADEEKVLEALQLARDGGLPIVDRGNGRFEMPGDLARALGASVIPSLRERWRSRLAGNVDPTGEIEVIRALIRAGDVRRAVELLSTLSPESPALRGRALLERARLRWLGEGIEPSFTLDGALAEATAARAQLGDAAPPRVRADAASIIAGIAYDIGDGASIEQASKVLGDTIVSLLRDGASTEAKLLINDQAALALRVGNAKKAKELAAQSLDLVGAIVKVCPTDADARADLADTHHLLARMPLHLSAGEARPGPIATALAHAAFAEAEYEALGRRRDLGRILETKARLAAMLGQPAVALESFQAAMRLADEAADLTGLARITAGLAELFADGEKVRDGLMLVNTSIELNREKGSAIGLAFDERALARIEDAVGGLPAKDTELAAEIRRTRERLTEAIEEGTP